MVSDESCPDLNIVITGPMGAGKTTVGREVARRLDRPFCDSDDQIRVAFEANASTLAAERGVERLHAAEAAALEAALESEFPVVVAAAASVADQPRLGRVLDGALVVLLDGRPEVLAARAEGGAHRRPLSEEAYRALTERRRARLSGHVDVTIDVTSIPPGEVADQVLEHCRRLSV